MMTTDQMNQMMSEFLASYNDKDEEIGKLKAELAEVKARLAERDIEFERISIELQNATKPKERPDYGIRTLWTKGEPEKFVKRQVEIMFNWVETMESYETVASLSPFHAPVIIKLTNIGG